MATNGTQEVQNSASQTTFNISGSGLTFVYVFREPGKYTIGFNFPPQWQAQSFQPQQGFFGPQTQPPHFVGQHQTPSTPYNSPAPPPRHSQSFH